jgi:hypothetical protein
VDLLPLPGFRRHRRFSPLSSMKRTYSEQIFAAFSGEDHLPLPLRTF